MIHRVRATSDFHDHHPATVTFEIRARPQRKVRKEAIYRFVAPRKVGAFRASRDSSRASNLASSQQRKDEMTHANKIQDFDNLPNDAHVDVHVVALLFGCEPATVWARLRRNEMPEPRRFGAHTRWHVGTLRKILTEAPSPSAARGKKS